MLVMPLEMLPRMLPEMLELAVAERRGPEVAFAACST